jgi:hypothetical protein
MPRKKALITWGNPAQVADSKESLHCGRCSAKQGVYGKDFGIGPDGNPLSVVDTHAFDITITKSDIAAMCWRCTFSFYQKLN